MDKQTLYELAVEREFEDIAFETVRRVITLEQNVSHFGQETMEKVRGAQTFEELCGLEHHQKPIVSDDHRVIHRSVLEVLRRRAFVVLVTQKFRETAP